MEIIKRHKGFKMGIAIILLLAMVLIAFSGCSSGSSGEGEASNGEKEGEEKKPGKTYELSLTTHDPAAGPMTVFFEEWAADVKEATDGQVNITVYPGGTLAAGTDALEAVVTGTVDIGWCFTTFFPNQFPLADVITVPMIGLNHPSQAAEVLWDLYDYSEKLQDELKDYKVLMMMGNPSNNIVTTKKPVHTKADLAGLQMRALAGAPTELMKAWGGIPVLMSPADTYEAMSKGIIDGALFEYSGITTVNMHEYLNYYTEVDVYMGVFLLLMNKEKWEDMPADVQAAMDSVSLRPASIVGGKVFHDDRMDSRDVIESKGGTFITPTEEAIAEFKVAADEYAKSWADKLDSPDFDAHDYYNKTVELVKQHDKY